MSTEVKDAPSRTVEFGLSKETSRESSSSPPPGSKKGRTDKENPYEFLPPLPPDEYQALKEDIAAHGIQVPVEVDEEGSVLDGHQRVRIWHELREEGVQLPDYQRIVRTGMSEQEKQLHVLRLNLHRRHLTRSQRNELWAALRQDGMTYEAIGQAWGADGSTVRKALGKQVGKNSQPARVKGKDGKSYPAKHRGTSIFAADGRQAKRALAVAEGVPGDKRKTLTVQQAERLARIHRLAEERSEAAGAKPVVVIDDIDTRLGDFREVLSDLADESVDLILTDPLWQEDGLGLWSPLADLGHRLLAPGGLLVCYAPHLYLHRVISDLSRRLEYIWTMAETTTGAMSRGVADGFFVAWHPLLVFCKPPRRLLGRWGSDVIVADPVPHGDDRLHRWQKAENAVREIVERFTKPGDLVVDPFCGSGTTAAACKALGRRCVTCDIDPGALAVARERLGQSV